ncbi:MAG: hypothetical protein V9H69_06880 [Anaerolineae bacterium]
MTLTAPTVADVERISALADPVLRNLQITQGYHALAAAMAGLTGPGANWCAVATWASKQAGQSIRKEDLQRALQRRLRGSSDAGDAAQAMAGIGQEIAGEEGRSVAGAVEALWDALNPAAAFERTAEAVARGNRKVFEEIGHQFARFVAQFGAGQPDDEKLDAFCQGLRPGEPPDGQRYLRQAFTHYHRAGTATDGRLKSQLLLLANLEIGFHEQTRLQPEIVEAMNAPVVDPRVLRRRLVEELFPDPGSRRRYVLAGLAGRARPLLRARDHLADEAMRVGRLVVTERMMALDMPDGQMLRLGQDLRAGFPDLLRTVDLPELVALLNLVDATPDSPTGSGAAGLGCAGRSYALHRRSVPGLSPGFPFVCSPVQLRTGGRAQGWPPP